MTNIVSSCDYDNWRFEGGFRSLREDIYVFLCPFYDPPVTLHFEQNKLRIRILHIFHTV